MTFVLLTFFGSFYMKQFPQMGLFSTSEKNSKKKIEKSLSAKFWSCFSISSNYRFIMSTKIEQKSIPPIHGIRALGALWIIAGHVYYYAFGPTDNLQLIFSYGDSWILQPLFAAAISVDTFYVMRSVSPYVRINQSQD